MFNLLRTNSFRILAFFVILIIVNTVFSITIIYENQVDILSENAKLKAEKMISSAVLLLENSFTNINIDKSIQSDNSEIVILELKKIISPVIKAFAVFSDDGHVLYKTSGAFKLPENYILDGMKALTNTSFAGGNYFVNIDEANLAINFYIPLDKFGIRNLLLYTRHDIGELNDHMRALYSQASLLIIVVLILHGVFALYLYISYIHPINILEVGSKKIASGDFSERIEIQQVNEFGNLAKAFNFMADSIQNELLDHKERKEVAEASSRAKSEFLAQMSHEIRTPMNSIHGFIELMKNTGIDSKQTEYLNIISHSADDLLGIINDILDFSKIESGKLEIDEAEFNPVLEFDSIINLMSLKADEKNILVLSYIDPTLPGNCIGDPLRIKQVLTNLLSNAVKFTPEEGTVKIEILKESETENSCTLNFSVADNGIGISKHKQEKIFSSFSQEDSSITRKYGGTGLGLTISQNLVELMGGSLKLKSEKGIGSKFYFSIDLKTYRDISDYDDNKSYENMKAALMYSAVIPDLLHENIGLYLQTMGMEVSDFSTFGELNAAGNMDIIFILFDDSFYKESIEFFKNNSEQPAIYISQHKDMKLPENGFPDNFSILYFPITPGRLKQSITDSLHKEVGTHGKEILKVKKSGDRIYGAKILLAEDNSVNQMLMELLLKEYGISVDIAGNGLKAYDLFVDNDYDLIFMDIHMPVSDGIESTHMILEVEKRENKVHTPIVALTARAIKGDRELFLKSGMDEYLSKPIDRKKLEFILKKYLSKKIIEKQPAQEEHSITGADIMNIESVVERLELPRESVIKIIKNFLILAEDDLSKLQDAVNDQNIQQIYQVAHKIKGGAGNLDFNNIYNLALTIEEYAHRGEKADYSSMMKKLKEVYEETKKTFENGEQ